MTLKYYKPDQNNQYQYEYDIWACDYSWGAEHAILLVDGTPIGVIMKGGRYASLNPLLKENKHDPAKVAVASLGDPDLLEVLATYITIYNRAYNRSWGHRGGVPRDLEDEERRLAKSITTWAHGYLPVAV